MHTEHLDASIYFTELKPAHPPGSKSNCHMSSLIRSRINKSSHKIYEIFLELKIGKMSY